MVHTYKLIIYMKIARNVLRLTRFDFPIGEKLGIHLVVQFRFVLVFCDGCCVCVCVCVLVMKSCFSVVVAFLLLWFVFWGSVCGK